MKRLLTGFFLLLLPCAMLGCSSGGSSSPSDTQAHPEYWIKNHSADALASPNFDDCISCHGVDLKGNDGAVSCYACHAFNATPPFLLHPSTWTDTYVYHRGYAAINDTSVCAPCHGADLQGSVAAPSCFAGTFDSRSCHADGPGPMPHTLLNGAYLAGGVHGPEAEANLAGCQICHAQTGGPGTNPRFNVGIDSQGGTGCEACHGENYAHPPTWVGMDPLSHNLAGNIQNACTPCHGVNLDGGIGVSCLDCHGVTPVGDNASACISCHGQPPNGALPVGNISPNRQGRHLHVRWTRTGETCSRCHNGAGFGTANHFDETNPADVNFLRPDATDTITADSTDTNTTCTGVCHIVTDTVSFTYPHAGLTWY